MIAAIVALVAAIVQPRFAACPPGTWMQGIALSGAYRCYVTGGTLEQNDPPTVLVTTGRVWCQPDETPVLVDHRRARCRRGRGRGHRAQYDARGRRIYRSDLYARLAAQQSRAARKALGLCINGKSHGKSTHGVRCKSCHETHRRSA